MNERTFRFPSGWEWVQLRQPFAQELHSSLPMDDRSSMHAEFAHSQAIPPRSSRAAVPDKLAAANRIQIDASRDKLERDRAQALLLSLKQRLPECAAWLDDCFERSANQIVVHRLQDGEPVLYGTLLIQQSTDKGDIQPFRFWVTAARLITIHDDWRLSIRLQQPPWEVQLQQCASGQEAFVTLLSALLEHVHHGLDGFEKRLGELEHAMRRRNRMNLMTAIFERRYDLLHWSHLFMPIKELNGAVKEAFVSSSLFESEPFQRLQHKLERIESLLLTYAAEIDTLISMDDAISSFRGNDIMKTLTIITVLFTPATVAGTLWGMNFITLPWASESWGFIGMCAIVVAATALIYLWVWRKGWTGDLLNTRTASPQTAAAEPAPAQELRRSRKSRTGAKPPAADRADRHNTSADLFASRSVNDITFVGDKPRRRS